MKTSVGSQWNTLKNWKNYSDMNGNPCTNLVDFFIPEAFNDCDGRIPMIDGLNEKNQIYCMRMNWSQRIWYKNLEGEIFYFIDDFLQGIF